MFSDAHDAQTHWPASRSNNGIGLTFKWKDERKTLWVKCEEYAHYGPTKNSAGYIIDDPSESWECCLFE